jgi:hypothetical protein
MTARWMTPLDDGTSRPKRPGATIRASKHVSRQRRTGPSQSMAGAAIAHLALGGLAGRFHAGRAGQGQ